MPFDPALIDQFASITGEKYALRKEADQEPYLVEWRGLYRGKTPLVLLPGTVAEVQAIMALANETRTPIAPQSGNTGLVLAQTPDKDGSEIALSLKRLDKIRAIDPGGNTITVEAGVTLQRVQEAADEANRLFPLSLASEGTCRIGGNLGTNAGGTGVLAYGNARDLTLGVEVVLADGRLFEGLRWLRKDNTGYDLKDLFIGSEGTLGIITAAVLKLFPKPAETTTSWVGLASLEAVKDFFERARATAGPGLTAFELMPRLAMEFLLRHLPGARDPLSNPYPWYVLMDIDGHQGDGESRAITEKLLAKAIEDGVVQDAFVAETISQGNALWHLRESLSELQKKEGGSIKHDVSVPIAAIPELITRGNVLLEEAMPGVRPLPFGHFGDGNIHYNVQQPVGMDTKEFLRQWDRISGIIYGLVRELHGSISAEHGIGRLKREQLRQVKGPVEMQLMQALKNALDPRGILNPGRIL